MEIKRASKLNTWPEPEAFQKNSFFINNAI